MEQIFAQVNHSRWIAICPRCQNLGLISAAEVSPENPIFVCPEEYPGTQSNMLVPHPHHRGAFLSTPDEDARRRTREESIAAGDAYVIIFPIEKTEIERLLRYRPRAARNWSPGVSLDDLRSENERMGVTHD